MKKQHIYAIILLVLVGAMSIGFASAQTSTAVSKLDAVKAKIAAKFDGLIAKTPNAAVSQKLTDQKAKHTTAITSMQTAVSSIQVSASDIQSRIAAKRTAIEQFCSANPGKCQTKRS